jgi:hypothetical protein
MEDKPEGRRSVGRPKLRKMDCVLEDLRKLESWRKVLWEAEAHVRL